MELTIAHEGYYATLTEWNSDSSDFDRSNVIPVGTKVVYQAHVLGGMVKVRYNDEFVIINPKCTVELANS